MEPRRLLEESTNDIERALLSAGAEYRCSPTSRAKTLAALGLAGSAALTAASVGVSVTSAIAKWGWPKILFAVAALGAFTSVPVGYVVWKHYQGPWVHEPAPRPVAVNPGEQRVSGSDLGQAVQVDGSPPAVMPSEESTKSAPSSRSEPKGEPSAALSEELNALDSVRSMLAQEDPTGALARLDSYNRMFPKGRLQLEAEVLRIDALVKSGQQDLARKRAQAFLAKHPNSVLATRVRGLL